tara:strand:- start:31 stop:1065 length:1035 start_codon:yes stop_codon:yes gene_type:complete
MIHLIRRTTKALALPVLRRNHTTTTKSLPTLWKTRAIYTLSGCSAATLVRTAWSHSPKRALCASASQINTTTETTKLKPASHIKDIDIVLYQYKICPFCNKIKAFLDFYGLAYTTIEVNPLTKEEIKNTLDTEYKKVPICVIDGEIICDSPVIMQKLQALLQERNVLLSLHETNSKKSSTTSDTSDATNTTTTTKTTEEKTWTEWVDKSLAVLLFPNITRNFPECWQAFSYISDVDSFSFVSKGLNRVISPIAMWAVQGKIKKKYNIEDEREAMFEKIYEWADVVEKNGNQFHGGNQPSLADLSVFGTLRSITGLDTHTEVVNDPRIINWYTAMIEVVGDSAEK